LPIGSVEAVRRAAHRRLEPGGHRSSTSKKSRRTWVAAAGLVSDVVATPQIDWLKAGTLDDTSWLEPSANIWCNSAQRWVPYAKGTARFAENPPVA
jgi:hypothetical protein